MSRQVVVLREGPPKRRGAFIDAMTGVLGVLLLIAAGVLGETLPEEEFVPVQYAVTFPTNGTNGFFYGEETGQPVTAMVFNQNNPFTHGETKRLPVAIAHDNIISITVQVFLEEDDYPSSLSDQFSYQMLTPEGEPLVSFPFSITTRTPEEVLSTDIDPLTFNPRDTTWVTRPIQDANNYRINTPPDPYFISGPDGEDVGIAQAVRSAAQNHTIPSKGDWILEVTLRDTGDCPQPGTDAKANRRAADCQNITERDGHRGEDNTNGITIKAIRYDYYDIVVTPPS